jgi:hypothetical protein
MSMPTTRPDSVMGWSDELWALVHYPTSVAPALGEAIREATHLI